MQAPSRLCILVVDDDQDWRRIISSLLRNEGHLVKCASRDREADAQLEKWPFDLVLMNALLRGEITDLWRFSWTVLMGDAKGAGSEVIVITSLDKAMGKTVIDEVAARSKARKVFFKSELERDALLREVHTISTRWPTLTAPQPTHDVACRSFPYLSYVLAFHTRSNDLSAIQKALSQQYPEATFEIRGTASYAVDERFQQVWQVLQDFADKLAAIGPDEVCALCQAVLDVQARDEDLRENLRKLCHCPREFQDAWPSSREVDYDLSVIRDLLRAAFEPKDLVRFCRDRPVFYRVLYSLGDDPGLDSIIDALLVYCEQHLLLPRLLTDVEKVREAQFQRFRAFLVREHSPSNAGT